MAANTFSVRVDYDYQAWELPSPRHRKLRPVAKTGHATIQVPSITSAQAPVVARVPHTTWSTNSQDETVYEDIRGWDGQLWSPYLQGEHSKDIPPVKAGSSRFPRFVDKTGWHYGRDQAEAEEDATREIRQALIIDGIVHCRRDEPVYYVRTFGLTRNHGGTSLFIGARSYDPDNPLEAQTWPVTAPDAAVAGAERIALERGDTESVARLREAAAVEVLDPSYFTQPTAEETIERKRAEVKRIARKAKAAIKVDQLAIDDLDTAIDLLKEVRDAIWQFRLD